MNNIVLIGMPGSGKSSVGRALAKMLHRPFVDTDHLIEAMAQKTISAIFAEDGEAHFRDLETRCVHAAAAQQGRIIATGGGVILRPENMQALAAHGVIVFLDRPVTDIVATASLADRPLVREDADKAERLWNLYRERIDRYRALATHHVQNTGPIRATARRIVELCQELSEGLLAPQTPPAGD